MDYLTFKKKFCTEWFPQHYYSLCQVHNALQRIALKYFPVIPQRKIHNCQNMKDALQLLEKWKLLSYYRLAILIELSDLLQGPSDIIKNELLRLNPKCGSVSSCNCYDNHFIESNIRHNQMSDHKYSKTNYDSLYSKVYQYLSENMGLRWIDFGRTLPGMRDRTEELRNDFSLRQKDKIITLLKEFEQSCKDDVLMQILYFLNICKMKRQSDDIQEKFGHLLNNLPL